MILAIVFIAGCTNQGSVCNPPYISYGSSCCPDQNNNSICDFVESSTNIKPKVYCGPEDVFCQEFLKNCTEFILIMESKSEVYPGLMTMTVDITNITYNCRVLYHVDKSDIPGFENTSMKCNYPLVNGYFIVRNDYCTGSLKDKLTEPPPVKGFTTIEILQPWSLSPAGILTANLENRVGSAMNVTRVYIWTQADITKSGNSANIAAFSISQIQIVYFQAIPEIGGKIGDKFVFNVSIEYTKDGINYFNSTGTIRGQYS